MDARWFRQDFTLRRNVISARSGDLAAATASKVDNSFHVALSWHKCIDEIAADFVKLLVVNMSKSLGLPIDAPDRALTTGQVARRFRISLQTLYHYESQGLLMPRWSQGKRLYDPDAVERLSFILVSKRKGMSLAKIAAIVAGESVTGTTTTIIDFERTTLSALPL